MIIYSDRKRFDAVPFPDYLQMPGYSHSFMKLQRNGIAEDLAITENIRMGKLVDGILTSPGSVDITDPLYRHARDIAHDITRAFGPFIKQFISQISYTAKMEFNGFKMHSKGRLDWLIPAQAVIDLKVTKSRDMRGLIEFMGYKNQLWHYCKLANVDKGFLMIHSIPLKKTELLKINCADSTNLFWADKIMQFGKVECEMQET